ncbi:MAG TPA: FAD-dependent oxidoreductase [Terriglobia bacterium]|nr:FAD-dependent oxidoreductase [Terriglobia bacterium]
MTSTAFKYRYAESDAAQSEVFDVVVIGAGVTGACLFHQLRQKGFRVLLADKSDFSGGTSQASAMMLWGGLAYLRSFDIPTVFRLCTAREALIRGMRDCAQPRTFRYIVPNPRAGNRVLVQSALYLYWLLGGFRRSRPRAPEQFSEAPLLREIRRNCFEYEEAYLPDSDARFVMQWILRARDIENPALNYCQLRDGHFDSPSSQWRLEFEDRILKRSCSIKAKIVVNAAGVWADSINENFGVETPCKHVLSKGVFIGLRRDPSHVTPLIIEKADQDCYALIPWGPISVWGPTETLTSDVHHGFNVTAADIHLLVDEYDKHFARPLRPEDVISLRCGVRGLAVPRSMPVDQYRRTQGLSRKFVVYRDPQRPWITIHGGKLTGCVPIADSVLRLVRQSIQPSMASPILEEMSATPTLESFPGLKEKVPSADWCAREGCWFLEDYLRRRSNIAQWVPRGALGHFNENAGHLERLASRFLTGHDTRSPYAAVKDYQHEIETRYDRVLSECSLTTAPVEVL